MVRGGRKARARGRRRQKVLLGLLLRPLARLIMLPAPGARRTLGHLPLHSSREPSRPGLTTPGPHSAQTWGCRQVPRGAQRQENLGSPRAGPGTSGPSVPAPVCQGSRSEPDCLQVQTASRLLTALPARRPLKRKRAGETARVKKESALPGLVAGANRRGCGVSPRSFALFGSSAILRLPQATPAHRAPPPHDSTPKPEDSRPCPPPPTLPQLRKPHRRKERATGFPRLSTRFGARVETQGLLFMGVIKNDGGG